MKPLSQTEIQSELVQLSEWSFINNAIEKKWVFNDFLQAMQFINKIAFVAEKQNHHPEWTNVYNKVIIKLSTHDSNGVTSKDIALAKSIETIYKQVKFYIPT